MSDKPTTICPHCGEPKNLCPHYHADGEFRAYVVGVGDGDVGDAGLVDPPTPTSLPPEDEA